MRSIVRKLNRPAATSGLVLAAAVGCGDHEPVPTESPPAAHRWWFTEITDEVGLHATHDAGARGDYGFEEIMGAGAAMFDFDGDGRLDIYLVNGATMDRLYRQASDGSFVDVTVQSGIRALGYGIGCAVGDYDNDGDPDLYVTNFGANQLWRNNGDGTFADVTSAAGLDESLWSVSAGFLDYDRDGLLDLYVVNYVLDPNSAGCFDNSGRPEYCSPQSFLPAPDALYHNEGNGRFRNVSVESGIARVPGPGLGIVCADFNDDGWIDVYVANDGAPNDLWINRHDGTFEETAMVAGCAYNRNGDAEAGMGIALGDVNGDGRLDLFVTHLRNQTNTLYRGAAHDSFVDATDMSGLGMSSHTSTGFGTGLVDLDHDGDLDLVVVNGAVTRRSRPAPGADVREYWQRYAEPNLLYVNNGAGKFTDASSQAGPFCTRPEVSRGLAFGDVDGDGDLDLLVTQGGGPARLFRNDVDKHGRWVIVRAIDGAPGRDALGAVVSVTAGGRTFRRTIVAASSYACSSEPIAHFGLGDAASVEGITVRWPDGMEERFAGVPVDSAVELRRGTGEAHSGPTESSR